MQTDSMRKIHLDPAFISNLQELQNGVDQVKPNVALLEMKYGTALPL